VKKTRSKTIAGIQFFGTKGTLLLKREGYQIITEGKKPGLRIRKPPISRALASGRPSARLSGNTFITPNSK